MLSPSLSLPSTGAGPSAGGGGWTGCSCPRQPERPKRAHAAQTATAGRHGWWSTLGRRAAGAQARGRKRGSRRRAAWASGSGGTSRSGRSGFRRRWCGTGGSEPARHRRERAGAVARACAGLRLAGASAGKQRRCAVRMEQQALGWNRSGAGARVEQQRRQARMKAAQECGRTNS
jgi:hypothetical protein